MKRFLECSSRGIFVIVALLKLVTLLLHLLTMAAYIELTIGRSSCYPNYFSDCLYNVQVETTANITSSLTI